MLDFVKVEIREMSSKGGSPQVYPDALSRAKIPGGWLLTYYSGGLTFVPDPEHRWDGSSLP